MTFDFLNPKPSTTLGEKKYKGPVKRQHSWTEDRYDITGGSFPPRLNTHTCEGCPGKEYDDRNYTNNFLRSQLMQQSPVTLCAMKNTPTTNKLLHKPKIEFTSPKFIHKPGRSTSFLRVPTIYKTGVCKINENLTKNDRVTRGNEYKKIRDQFEEFMISKNMQDAHKKAKLRRPSMALITKGFEARQPKSEDNLIKICKRGELLQHVRRNVVEDIKRMELEDAERKLFRLPTVAQIRLEIDHFNTNPNDYPPERYSYDPDAGMAMMCARKQFLAKFHESQSEKDLRVAVKPEESKFSMLKFPQKSHVKLNELTPSTIEIFKRAPCASDRGSKTVREPHAPCSHFGLVERCKEEAYKETRYQLARRERDYKIPEEFFRPMYGPIKGVPGDYKIEVPAHLAPNVPPTPEELKKVEEAMEHDKKLEKARRKQGKLRPGAAMEKRFTKSLIESDEEILHPQEVTRLLFPRDDPKKSQVAARNSSETLFCTVGQTIAEDKGTASEKPSYTYRSTLPWINSKLMDSNEKASRLEAKYQKEWRINSRMSTIVKPPKPKLSLTSFDSDSLDDEEGIDDFSDLNAVDSREALPYSDVAFSDIEFPKNVREIPHEHLYQLLVEEEKSSSDKNTAVESDSYSEESFEDEEDEHEDEEEEDEDEEEEHMRTKRRMHKAHKHEGDHEITLLRSILKTQMDLEHIFTSPDLQWQKLLAVERVPAQIELEEDSESKPLSQKDQREQSHFWEKIFGIKSMRELERKKRAKEATATLKLLSDPNYDDKFDFLQQREIKRKPSFKSRSNFGFFGSSSNQSSRNELDTVDDAADENDGDNDDDDDDTLKELFVLTNEQLNIDDKQ